jgi:hypothetical protein
MGSPEVGPPEMGSAEMGSAEMGSAEMGSLRQRHDRLSTPLCDRGPGGVVQQVAAACDDGPFGGDVDDGAAVLTLTRPHQFAVDSEVERARTVSIQHASKAAVPRSLANFHVGHFAVWCRPTI